MLKFFKKWNFDFRKIIMNALLLLIDYADTKNDFKK